MAIQTLRKTIRAGEQVWVCLALQVRSALVSLVIDGLTEYRAGRKSLWFERAGRSVCLSVSVCLDKA